MWLGRLQKDVDMEKAYYVMKDSVQGKGVRSPITLAPPPNIDNVNALNTYVRDGLINIVSGVKPISFLNEMIKYWDDNGGKNLTDFYNAWYYKK
jgi:hypothetical protein